MTDTHSDPATTVAVADFLYGIRAIGDFLGIRQRQAEHLIVSGVLPAFKVGKTVCAKRSVISAAFDALAASAPPVKVRKR